MKLVPMHAGVLTGLAAILSTVPGVRARAADAVMVGSVTDPAAGDRLHTIRRFDFVAHGTLAIVAPLFGADRERLWAPDWNPDFLWPTPVNDQQGMVFTVNVGPNSMVHCLGHGPKTAVWVNTCYDPLTGRFQYLYVIPDIVATMITIALTARGDSTDVAVSYERTALSSVANDLVGRMAEQDGRAGPEWQSQIDAHLATLAKAPAE